MFAVIYFFWLLKCCIYSYYWPFNSSQLLIFLGQLFQAIHKFLLLIQAFLTLFNSLYVINTYSVLFFMDAGSNIPNDVNLYITFLYFLSELIILSSPISIWTWLSPPTISKFCWARILIVPSVDASVVFFSFLFLSGIDYYFLSIRVGRFPLMLASWKFKESLFVSLLTKNLRKFSGLIILNISFSVFSLK